MSTFVLTIQPHYFSRAVQQPPPPHHASPASLHMKRILPPPILFPFCSPTPFTFETCMLQKAATVSYLSHKLFNCLSRAKDKSAWPSQTQRDTPQVANSLSLLLFLPAFLYFLVWGHSVRPLDGSVAGAVRAPANDLAVDDFRALALNTFFYRR